jgi:FKBP-type peptidyl-prolyl cis-trans isomerase FklB
MKKSILWVIGLLFSVSFAVTSCEETDGAVDPYFNWRERNELYIDSIARVAEANLGDEVGQWKKVHTYKFVPPINDLNPDVNDYVYCRVIKKGTGTVKPLYTDTVSTHYRGQLIPLYDGQKVVFDQSFQGDLKEDVAIPVGFPVSGVIEGWTSVLQQMVEGDRWEVHIPWQLSYGKFGSGDIPGYSALVFDMQLVKLTTNR